MSTLLISVQGFDEFMNLVIDNAVEIKQATKTTDETRKPLGTPGPIRDLAQLCSADSFHRPDFVEGR